MAMMGETGLVFCRQNLPGSAHSLWGWLQTWRAYWAASKKRDSCYSAPFHYKISFPLSWQDMYQADSCGCLQFIWVQHEQRFDRKQDLNVLERDCICNPEAAELLHHAQAALKPPGKMTEL